MNPGINPILNVFALEAETDRCFFPRLFRTITRLKRSGVAAVLLCGMVCFAAPVQIDFFYEPGCGECERIEAEVLPRLEKQFGHDCVFRRHDIGVESNFVYLLELESAAGFSGSERGYLVVGKRYVFGSQPDFEELVAAVEEVRCSGSASGERTARTESVVAERFRGFTLIAVLAAGLLDGINPCAISTLVFFMSLLAISKIRNRPLILLGVSYVLASFLTYLALGFGLFRVLHLFAGFKLIRSAIEWSFVAILLVFAGISFCDAVRFRKSRDGNDVILQLSTGMKQRIHGVMRRGLKTGHLIFGGFSIGVLVTALESVCTGQVYVPTLVLILKNNAASGGRALGYLLAYNLMFVLPLIAVFAAVYRGLKTETLLSWSRRNVVVSKLLLALFFTAMALLLLRL
jgi:cytochrome c biogenesis protein CcdA